MRLLTTYEFHYLQYEDGFYDPQNRTGGDHFSEQLAVFEKVILVARCRKTTKKPECARVDNEKIEFFPVADFNGYIGFFGQLKAFWQCRKTVGMADWYWLRSPGFIASMVAFWLRRKKVPFFLHVAGDPAAVAQTKAYWMPLPLAKIAVKIVEKRFKCLVKSSSGALFVTEETLQKRYPSSIPANDFGVSDVRLPDSIFEPVHRDFSAEILKLVVVGVLLKYKGHRYLFEALAKIKNQRKWRLMIVGEGTEEQKLKQLAQKLCITENIVWMGRLTWGQQLFEALDKAHLFVLPSLTEGMPRALLEAMARALPAIATDVGGTCEIVPKQWLVPPENAQALAAKIAEIWKNPEVLQKLSNYNFQQAQNFRLEQISAMRQTWFEWVKLHSHEADIMTWEKYCKSTNHKILTELEQQNVEE